MNIFSTKTVYGKDSWNEIERRAFESEEIKQVSKVKVTQGDYGLSACFIMKSGGSVYIPISTESEDSVNLGDILDINDLTVVTLERNGTQIDRIVVK